MSYDDGAADKGLQNVIGEVARRRNAGEALRDEDVLRAHPELPGELLREALGRLRRIGIAQEQLTRTHVPSESDVVRVIDSYPSHSTDSSGGQADQVMPERVARFAPVAVLGAGSFGTVYKAYDPQHDCLVALKISKRAIHAMEDEAAFFREARAAAQLDHPGIVHVRDSGRDGDRFYIVSDYIHGETLEESLAKSAFTFERAVATTVDICDALHHAHLRGVVHRDLKPSNVMLDEAGKPRVMDFGLAKRIDGDATVTMDGNVVGTVAYMSPQQAVGANSLVDGRSDIYSLGVTLFEMLTSERPFRGTPFMVRRQVVEDEPPAPRSLNDKVPRDLETIVLRCLEKEPEKRFGTANDLKEELLRFRSGEPIKSRPISPLERLWRWCKRRPATAGLYVATTLLLAAAVGAGAREIYMQRQARAQLSENLLTTAGLYGRRGEWQEALAQIAEAQRFGHADPVRLRIERVKALEALNRVGESREAIDALAAEPNLGAHGAEVAYLQGISLMNRGEHDVAVAKLRAAERMGSLSPSDSEIVKGMLERSSPAALQRFRQALELDPFSHDAHGLVIFALSMAGEDAEAMERIRVATFLYPDDPNFPLLAAFILGKRGETDRALEYLAAKSCSQLEPSLVSAYRDIIENLPALTRATMELWDFEHSDDFEKRWESESATAAAKMQQAIRTIGSYGGTTTGVGGIVNLLQSKGPPCYEAACAPLLDLASLRTMGFVTQKAGDSTRIDELIDRLDASAGIHPDSFFDFARGRLLYARERFAEATEAFSRASERKSMLGDFAALSAYSGARCEFERYQRKEVTSLSRAIEFVRKRLKSGTISARHAKLLLGIALESQEYDVARNLAVYLDASPNKDLHVKLIQAEIEERDRQFLAALQILSGSEFHGADEQKAAAIRKRCILGLKEVVAEGSTEDATANTR